MEYILIIIAFNMILFFRTLRFSICVDDIRRYKSIQDGVLDTQKTPINWLKIRLYGGGTFGPARKGEAPDAHIDHAFTILLHTLASVIVYLAFGSSEISFWSAILYSCNPTNTQTSVWLNGRRYLINVILVLSMVMVAKLQYGWIACLPLYAATSMFHVTAFAAPVLFIGWYSIPLALCFYALFHNKINGKIKERMASLQTRDFREFTPKRLIVVVKCYGFFLTKMLFPGITLMNYPNLFFWGITKDGNNDAYRFNYDFYVGIFSIFASVCCIVALPDTSRPLAGFAALAILQWCAIIPATQLLADRYTSTAMPFVMFFVAYFVHTPIVLMALAGFYVARLWYAMDMFTSIWHYYKYQLYHAPHITTPRKDLINYLINVGDYMKAWHYTREGLDISPNDFSMLHRAAICAKAVGSRKQALEYLAKAEQHPYIDQEDSQMQWCEEFRRQTKQEDVGQLNRKRF